MLDKRIYSRQELIDIYKTDRLDAIKKKISREGYSYKDCGRGKSYTMEILSLPDNSRQFKEYCIKEMGFVPQTNFIILKYFLYNVITNDEFITLQYNEMAEILKEQMKDILEKEKISVTAQTISKYFKQLQENDWICLDGVFEFTYYVYDTSINHNRYIDKKEYCEMYKNYWITLRATHYDFDIAENQIRAKYGSKPKKRAKANINAFCFMQYNAIQEFLEKESF